MREPSIHITQGVLASLLKDVFAGVTTRNANYEKLAGQILEQAKVYSLSNRALHITNDKQKRDAAKVVMAGRNNTSIFITTLILLRRKAHIRGLVSPKPGTTEYLSYKEPTKLAEEFCHEFQLPIKEGFKEYLQIALPKMKNFSLFKLKTIHASIIKEYEAIEVIRGDKHTQDTIEAHKYYLSLIRERIGFAQGFEDLPEKYACFVEVVKICKKLKVSYKQYIQAQFTSLDWASAIPDPYQLVGVKAMGRLQKYCYENDIKVQEEEKVRINFNTIKQK